MEWEELSFITYGLHSEILVHFLYTEGLPGRKHRSVKKGGDAGGRLPSGENFGATVRKKAGRSRAGLWTQNHEEG